MEKKKVAYLIIKALSEEDKANVKQQIKCCKSSKLSERLEKLFVLFEKSVLAENIDDLKPTKLTRVLKLSSPKKLTPLYTELISYLENYLINSELRQHHLQQKILLQKALSRRKENEYISTLHSKIREIITEIKIPSTSEYELYSTFYSNLYQHANTNTHKGESLVYLNRSEVNLDTAFWIKKLRILLDKANRGLVISEERHLLSELPSLPDLSPYTFNDNTHLLSIYEKAYKFILAPFSKAELSELIVLISQNSLSVTKEDKERIFNFLMSVVSYYLPTNKTDLSPDDIYQVYKLAFTNLWLVQDDGNIYFEDFINILYLAFEYKDIDLLENIESEYGTYIPEGYPAFVGMLSKGFNFYLHQKWDAVLKTFSQKELPNIEHRFKFIFHRNLLVIKSLFEFFIHNKYDCDDIPSYLDKHNKFIKRKSNSNSSQFNDRNLNFLKLVKKLYNYLVKRSMFNFDKDLALKEISKWTEDVEEIGTQSIANSWLKQVGESLLEEVQQSPKTNSW